MTISTSLNFNYESAQFYIESAQNHKLCKTISTWLKGVGCQFKIHHSVESIKYILTRFTREFYSKMIERFGDPTDFDSVESYFYKGKYFRVKLNSLNPDDWFEENAYDSVHQIEFSLLESSFGGEGGWFELSGVCIDLNDAQLNKPMLDELNELTTSLSNFIKRLENDRVHAKFVIYHDERFGQLTSALKSIGFINREENDVDCGQQYDTRVERSLLYQLIRGAEHRTEDENEAIFNRLTRSDWAEVKKFIPLGEEQRQWFVSNKDALVEYLLADYHETLFKKVHR